MSQPSGAAARERAAVTECIVSDAARIAEHLEAVRRTLRASIWTHASQLPVPLTAPQVHALEVLVDAQRSTGEGLSLSALSGRMGLAHSTVSGIVTRLAKRDLLTRRPAAQDRRFVSIELTEPVKGWLEHELPASRLAPLTEALRRASAQEYAAVLDGVATLERLLTTNDSVGHAEPNPPRAKP
jgi:DNA-binding MarR family transcriptional regulator